MYNNFYSLLPIINIIIYLFIFILCYLLYVMYAYNIIYVNLLVILFYSIHFIQLFLNDTVVQITYQIFI